MRTGVVSKMLRTEDGGYEVQGSGIQVKASLKQMKDGTVQVDLSGKGAKKFKEEILQLLEEAGFRAPEHDGLTLEVTPHELGGYSVKGKSVSVTATMKRGAAPSAFGWEGFQLSGRGAEKHREEILQAIEAYREEQDLHPLCVLPPSKEAQPGQHVRIIGNTVISRQSNGKLDVAAEKEKYVGAVAEVKAVRHSLQAGTQYLVSFLDESLEQQQAKEGGHVFAKREVLPV